MLEIDYQSVKPILFQEITVNHCAYIRIFFLLALSISPLAGKRHKNMTEPAQAATPTLRSVVFDKDTHSTVIIGGGIAGLTAGIYAGRAGYTPLIIDGPTPGGLLTQSHSVKNWPGELEISGDALVKKIKKQAQECGAIIENMKVTAINTASYPYTLTLQNVLDSEQTRTVKALSIVLAMGTSPLYLGVPGEKEYWGHGVSNCAVCDGNLYAGKDIAIVGGGDAAITEAAYLSRIARKVYILIRRDQLRATDKRKDEVLAKANVEVRFDTSIVEIKGTGTDVTSLVLKNNKTNTPSELAVSGVFLAIGSTPNTELIKSQIDCDAKGYISLKTGQQTSKEGIFAAGDICDPIYKQAISSAGDGAKAALEANKFLEHLGYDPKKHIAIAEAAAKPEVTPAPKPAPKPTAAVGVTSVSSEEQFNRIMSNGLPSVVDFYANWCGPCRQMAPTFDRLAQDFAGRVNFMKVNIDQLKGLANRMNVRSIPAFILYNTSGNRLKMLVGTQDYNRFKSEIQQNLIK